MKTKIGLKENAQYLGVAIVKLDQLFLEKTELLNK
jgi:hypothetical protein